LKALDVQSDEIITETLQIAIKVLEANKKYVSQFYKQLSTTNNPKLANPIERLASLLNNEAVAVFSRELIAIFFVNMLVLLPRVESSELLSVLEKLNFASKLLNLSKHEPNSVKPSLLRYQTCLLESWYEESRILFNASKEVHQQLLQRITMYNDYLQNYSSEVFWVGVNLLTIKSWLFFGENYYPVYRRLLDEHEGMDPTDYPLSLVMINITQIILEWFFGNETLDKQVNHMLFDGSHVFNDLFCCGLMLFDRFWSECEPDSLRVHEILGDCREWFHRGLDKTQSILEFKKFLDLRKILEKTDTLFITKPPLKLKKPFTGQVDATLEPKEPYLTKDDVGMLLLHKLIDSAKELSNPYNDSNFEKPVSTALDLCKSRYFPWDLVPLELIRFVTSSIPQWQRQAQAAVYGLKLLLKFLEKATSGHASLVDVFQRLAQQKSEDPYRIMLKMLRNNRTFYHTLKLINSLLQSAPQTDKMKMLKQFEKAEVLSILKSKVWISHDKSKLQLAYFQAQITSLECAPFDHNNQAHVALVRQLYYAAFPHIRLQQLSPVQFELLGFQGVKTLADMNGRNIKGISFLVQFSEQYPKYFRDLITFQGKSQSLNYPTCHVAVKLADILFEKLGYDILKKSSTPKDAQKRIVRAKELGNFVDVSIVPLLFDNLNYLYDMFTVVLITFDMRWMQALIFPSTLPLSPTASSMDSSRERQAEKERDREANAQLSASQTILPSAEKSLLHSSSVISNSGPATIGSDGPDSTKNDNSSGTHTPQSGLGSSQTIAAPSDEITTAVSHLINTSAVSMQVFSYLENVTKDLEAVFQKKPTTIDEFKVAMNAPSSLDQPSAPLARQNSKKKIQKFFGRESGSEGNLLDPNRKDSGAPSKMIAGGSHNSLVSDDGSSVVSDYVEQYLTEHAVELKERSEALAQQSEKDVSGVRMKINKKLVSKARIARTGSVPPKSPRPSVSAESPRSVKSPFNKKKLEQVFGSSTLEETEKREDRVIKDLAKQRDKEINKQIEYKETLDKLHIYEETYYEALKKLSETKGD
jgi:hypothetical protein